jgi:hypothetical protein
MNYVKMCHIDKLYPHVMWKLNHNFFGVKSGESISKHFVLHAMEVWSTLYPIKPFGV